MGLRDATAQRKSQEQTPSNYEASISSGMNMSTCKGKGKGKGNGGSQDKGKGKGSPGQSPYGYPTHDRNENHTNTPYGRASYDYDHGDQSGSSQGYTTPKVSNTIWLALLSLMIIPASGEPTTLLLTVEARRTPTAAIILVVMAILAILVAIGSRHCRLSALPEEEGQEVRTRVTQPAQGGRQPSGGPLLNGTCERNKKQHAQRHTLKAKAHVSTPSTLPLENTKYTPTAKQKWKTPDSTKCWVG